MTVITDGLNSIAFLFGGSGHVISYTAIGTGSETITDGMTTLTTEVDRNQLVQPTNDATQLLTVENNTVTAISNFTSVEMSGISLSEFGTFNNDTTGNMFNKEVIGSVTFDGDIELQTHNTFRFIQA